MEEKGKDIKSTRMIHGLTNSLYLPIRKKTIGKDQGLISSRFYQR